MDTGSILKDKLEESLSSVQLLNPQTDTKIFIDENRSKHGFLEKKEFVSYDYSKKLLKNRQDRVFSTGLKEEDFGLFEIDRRESIESASSYSSTGKSSQDQEGQRRKSNLDTADLLGLGDYEERKDEKQETDLFNDNKSFVYACIDGLFCGQELDNEAQLKVFELLHLLYL